MASSMASSIDLQQFVNCDICFEMFQNPQNLSCGHSFCKQCVDKMTTNSIVTCPKCKRKCNCNEIRVDYTIIALVDSYNSKQERVETGLAQNDDDSLLGDSSTTTCEGCFTLGKPIACKCETCHVMLCQTCSDTHCDSNPFALNNNHIVKPIESVVHDLHKSVTEVINELDTNKEKHLQTINDLTKGLRTVEEKSDEVFAQILANELDEIEAVKARHQKFRDEVLSKKLIQKEKMRQDYKTVKNALQGLIVKEHSLKGLATLNSDVEIADSVETIKVIVKEIKDQQTDIELTADYQNFTFDLSQLYEATKMITANNNIIGACAAYLNNSNNPLGDNSTITKNSGTKFLCSDFRLVERKNVPVFNLAVWNNNNLYVLFWAHTKPVKVGVIDGNFQQSRAIYLKYQTQPLNGLAITETGYFITTTETGLFVHMSNGEYIQKITQGCFHGVAVMQRKIYAYEKKQNKVFIFTQEKNQWIYKNSFLLKYFTTKHDYQKIESFRMSDEAVYISDDKLVYKLDFDGKLLQTFYGIQEMKQPIICQVSSAANTSSNIIVVDKGNNRVLEFNRAGESFEVDCKDGKIEYAVMDAGNETLWISNTCGVVFRYRK